MVALQSTNRTGLGGVRVSDQQMATLLLTRHEWHGDWRYTLRPSLVRVHRTGDGTSVRAYFRHT